MTGAAMTATLLVAFLAAPAAMAVEVPSRDGLRLWLDAADAETMPKDEDLPSTFTIEYVRDWQKRQ